jgi:hypothetical protein
MAILFLLLFVLSPAEAADNKQERAVELKQTHYFLGTHDVFVAKDAVRMENLSGFRYIIVSRAPDWRINVFRNDDKTYFSESLAEYAETGLVSDFLVSRRNHFLDPQKYIQTPILFLGRKAMSANGNGHAYKYLPAEKGTPTQIDLIIHSTYKLSTWGGLPLEETGVSNTYDHFFGQKKNHHQVYLQTSAIKTVSVSPDFFDMPKNFIRAKSLREVISGEESRAESVDAQELFNIGKKPGK